MANLQFDNKWILVTGASSGLGYEMARQLALRFHANLIVVARRKEKLESLKQELEQAAGVQVKIVVADLSKEEDTNRLLDECLKDGNLYGAILNAGVTYFGPHSALSWTSFESMLQLNVISIVRITNRLTTYFEEQDKPGGILLVSSMAAIMPTAYQAAYSGTKGFILNFATALSHELKNKQFSITVYMPGGIATEMTDNEKFSTLKRWLMPVEQAAKEGLDAFRKRKYTHIPGSLNRLGSVISQLIPKKIIAGKMAATYRKALELAEGK